MDSTQKADTLVGAEPDVCSGALELSQARASLDEAGRLIDVSLAERRNLIMQNPAPASNFETTRTLVCAYQMILPGEVAPSHRHSSHALRVILHGEGSYSVVNGQKMPMETGDIVLTPGGCWHGHLAVDRLESGQRTRRCRSTANTVFLAIEGSGESRIGDAKFAWQKCDAFVAPSWTKFEHAANSDSMLFILSDEPLLRFSNYYRFEAD
jgi:gentisate 1,2-dioxygenase